MNRRHAGALALVGWYFASAAAGEAETPLAHWESYRPPLRAKGSMFSGACGCDSELLIIEGVSDVRWGDHRHRFNVNSLDGARRKGSLGWIKLYERVVMPGWFVSDVGFRARRFGNGKTSI